jgi:hypothetical protein
MRSRLNGGNGGFATNAGSFISLSPVAPGKTHVQHPETWKGGTTENDVLSMSNERLEHPATAGNPKKAVGVRC